jgi:hypothetical protein
LLPFFLRQKFLILFFKFLYQFRICQHSRFLLSCLRCTGMWADIFENIYTRLVLRDFVLWDFALTQLENLHNFSNSSDDFRFNAIWHTRSVAAIMFCRRLEESDVTVTPSLIMSVI